MITRFIRNNFKIILSVVLTAIICISGTVFATGCFAKDVSYKKADGSELSVEQALNELYSYKNPNGNMFIGAIWNYQYRGEKSEFIVPCSGKYKIELWGAQGNGGSWAAGGKGSYVSGEIELIANTKLVIYVGGSGKNQGYNGGGSGLYGYGGGATDIRYDYDKNNEYSLQERIIVAAGGGGAYNYSSSWYRGGTYGGTINGVNGGVSTGTVATGGTQIAGGIGNNSTTQYQGGFGYGGNGNSGSGTGGGSGYYGGGGTYNIGYSTESAGSGSCFISGYEGCNAIDANGNHTNQSVHYSGLKFTNGNMIAGNSQMPSSGKDLITGNSGDGFARITLIEAK